MSIRPTVYVVETRHDRGRSTFDATNPVLTCIANELSSSTWSHQPHDLEALSRAGCRGRSPWPVFFISEKIRISFVNRFLSGTRSPAQAR